MFIPRIYNLEDFIKPNKVLAVFGPRQVGKTTLLKNFVSKTNLKYKMDSGENLRIQEILNSQDFSKITEYAQGYELIIIDEVQKIKNIGQGLKILVDQVPGIKIIVTGSSSFELAGQIGEPLTGRKITLKLFPLSQIELNNISNKMELRDKIEQYLIYGSYPEIIAEENLKEKRSLISEIVNSYLLKDILQLDKVKNSKVLLDLLRLLAFQVGSEVSLHELASQLGMDYKTIGRYIDLFEKSYVVYNLRGFSRNLRKEVTKKSKYYFYDNGIRNAIVANFNSINVRDDIGKLWENFLITERLKKQAYKNIYANNYFWRTWDQKEIDFIEEREGKLFGYEFKWNKKSAKAPEDWEKTYSEAEFEVINKENYLDFIC